MTKDLVCVSFFSIIGFSASLGIVVALGIEPQPDVLAIEALAISEPAAAGARKFLNRAGPARHTQGDEFLLTGH